jgi:hypothetical protein
MSERIPEEIAAPEPRRRQRLSEAKGSRDLRAGFCQHSRDVFRPMMSPGHFQSFPFYLPLLTAQTIAGRSSEEISHWLGNVEL